MSERGSSSFRRGRGRGGGGDQGRIRPRSPPRYGEDEGRDRYVSLAPTRRREEPREDRNARENVRRQDGAGVQECASRFGTRDVHMYTKVRQIGQGAYGFVDQSPSFLEKVDNSLVDQQTCVPSKV